MLAGATDTVTTPDDASLQQPFAAAVEAGAPFMMMSTAVYRRIDPGVPVTFSPVGIGLLRNRLHVAGLVVADDLGQAATADPAVRHRADDAALQVLVTTVRLGLLTCR